MEKRLKTVLMISGLITVAIVVLDFFLFWNVSSLFSSILIIAVIVFIVPAALIKYYESWEVKSLEDSFPPFIRDLVESVRAGMTLPQAIDSISQNDYGHLGPHVKKLNAQLKWGIPFSKALLRFSKNTRSKLIGRITSTIVESHRFGGNLTDIFESISKSSVEIERLREERKLYMHSQLMTGYIIYFVFLVVIISLQRFLVPTLSGVQVEGLAISPEDMAEEYNTVFRNLIIIQGLSAGLVIGKMSEGEIVSGVKHGLFLMIAGILIYTIAGFL